MPSLCDVRQAEWEDEMGQRYLVHVGHSRRDIGFPLGHSLLWQETVDMVNAQRIANISNLERSCGFKGEGHYIYTPRSNKVV